MMKYYIGYYNNPWDKSEFTVICGCPNKAAATFILEQYQNHPSSMGGYKLLTAAEAMEKTMIF